MPKTCSVCSLSSRVEIDQALVAEVPLRRVAEQYGTSATTLHRHKKDHLPAALAKAHDAEEVAQADDLLAKLVGLQDKALNILGQAEEAGDLRTALMAVREVRATMELVGKVTGELVHKQEVNLNTSVHWRFTIGKGWEEEDQDTRVVNGHVVDEIPPRVGEE